MSDTPPHETPGGAPDRREAARNGAPEGSAAPRRESLATLLGGRKGAIDASLPPVAFVVGWLASDSSIGWGAAAAIALSVVIGGIRIARGDKVRAVLISLAAVVLAALIALRTGRAQDFFLIQLLSNVASALAWAVSIVIRWPLLGVVVGTVLGQKTRWRADRDLLRAYSRASWVWVFGQYTLRVAVFGVLWWAGEVVALGVARTVLSWPLVALTVAVSGWVLHRSLPAEHPGLRHPVPPEGRDPGPPGAAGGEEADPVGSATADADTTTDADTTAGDTTAGDPSTGDTADDASSDSASRDWASRDSESSDAASPHRAPPDPASPHPASPGGANAGSAPPGRDN